MILSDTMGCEVGFVNWIDNFFSTIIVAGYIALADWTVYYVFNRNRLSENV